jgi:hypothetical protein
MGGLIDELISAKHSSLIGSAQMIAKNAGLDPTKTTILDKGGNTDSLANVATKAAQAPTKTANASGGAKTLTQAQIQMAAKDHNVSVEEATRQAKAAGYTIQ